MRRSIRLRGGLWYRLDSVIQCISISVCRHVPPRLSMRLITRWSAPARRTLDSQSADPSRRASRRRSRRSLPQRDLRLRRNPDCTESTERPKHWVGAQSSGALFHTRILCGGEGVSGCGGTGGGAADVKAGGDNSMVGGEGDGGQDGAVEILPAPRVVPARLRDPRHLHEHRQMSSKQLILDI